MSSTQGRRLYIGGLPYKVDERDLRDLCDKYGGIEDAFIVMDKYSEVRRSRGYGFITFEDKADARDCIAALDGTDYEGRRLNVQEAKPGGGAGRGGSGGGRRDFGGGGGGRRDDRRDGGSRGGRDGGYGGSSRGYGGRDGGGSGGGGYGGGGRRRDDYESRDRY